MGCAACLDWPAGLRAAAACLHEGAAAHLVRGLKYRGWTGLAAPMAKCMLPAARKLAGHDEPLLVPVPLSAARRRERGFNQAELLTAELAAHTGWPHGNLLIRRGAGRPFARSGKTERARRAAEAFDVAHGSPHRTADDWPVLLVDDVITTGATAGACAAVLAGAGFRCVGAVSFARTGRSLDRS